MALLRMIADHPQEGLGAGARKVWTLADANEALPMVRGLLADARRQLNRVRAAEDQLLDLRTVHGDTVMAVAHAAHAEWQTWAERREQARSNLAGVLRQFATLGLEPKDIDTGLVDFRGQLGAKPAYLCWKDGEESVGFWHTLEGGFAGRRPIPSHAALDDD